MTVWNLTLLVLYDAMVLPVYINATQSLTLKQTWALPLIDTNNRQNRETFKTKTFYIIYDTGGAKNE